MGARDLRLDLLRGFAVVAMIVDHVGGERSWLYAITGGDRFLFSAAEAFVFISGLTMGLVYARVIAAHGLAAAVRKALRRAGRLYLLTVLLAFAVMAFGAAIGLPWLVDLHAADPLRQIVERLTLRRAFYRVDVLLLYTLLVAAAPLALALLARRHTALLLVAAWTLWTLARRWPAAAALPWHVADSPMFPFATWQALFFTAMAIGYHRERIAAWAARSRVSWRPYLAALTALAIGAILFDRHHDAVLAWIAPHADPAALFVRFFDKPSLRIGRLAVFAVFFQIAWTLVTVAWRPIAAACGWLLLPLGRHALLAYGAHLFVCALCIRFAPDAPAAATGTPADTAARTLLQAASVAAVFAIVRAAPAVGARLAARRRDEAAAPAAAERAT